MIYRATVRFDGDRVLHASIKGFHQVIPTPTRYGFSIRPDQPLLSHSGYPWWGNGTAHGGCWWIAGYFTSADRAGRAIKQQLGVRGYRTPADILAQIDDASS